MRVLIGLIAFLSAVLPTESNHQCSTMDPICTSDGAMFTAQTGQSLTTSDAANDFTCLNTQPNPTWYYLEIATAGNIIMSLSAPSDIDFHIWGPFPDYSTAEASCNGGLTLSNRVDCSYSGTNQETPEIPNGQVGEVYVLVITNYAAVVQSVSLTKTGGTGATNCDILGGPVAEPCVSACGDPHLKSLAGKWFDYHGICDLVLISAPGFFEGLGLDIHIRTKPRYEYSYIEATSIKIGDDIMEVGSWGDYIYNGVRDAEMPAIMGGQYTVDYEMVNKKRHVFKIQTEGQEAIVVNVHKDMVNVNVEHMSPANFNTTNGILGNYRTGGSLLARDGATVMEDHDLFGQEWQVMQSDGQLFQSPSPYKQCVPPHTILQGRRLGEATVSKEADMAACAHYEDETKKDMCIFDVMAMADLEAADVHGTY